MPFFSIIIPLYNKEKNIAKTIQSVFDQDCIDFELIIINDGSTDKSEKVVTSFIDERIQYFLTENKGVANARNLGIAKAKGELIAFLDADDYWYPNHLTVLSKLYKKFPDVGLLATSYEKRFSTKSIFLANFKNINASSNSLMIVDDFFDSSSIDAIAWTSACAVPKSVFNTIKDFDSSITHGEDTDLWIRIALQYKVALATYLTATYNLDAKNRSKEIDIKKKTFLKFEKFEKEEKHNISLKKYLDVNRYSIALEHKISGDHISSKKYCKNIHWKNLHWKNRLLIKQPKTILLLLKKVQTTLIHVLGIKLSSFK
ncbi:Glycosyltransferase involved in cell wall bisynthesis [Aquimarina amphilecti]|uniref:Glycosyltransferase involved in cell wall bisynthesis n=1 Tax=Aquimarina amphilecti TaxID=1038014 RepID=A0A1H7WB76_AQUAM|nr:glycosyltransferase family 2 protein [Aquimarina amphilecti]SEM18741.1 Glycosyltransferase involved in cell wall bisynthesis [Aquimarina amphilecti]